MYIDNTISGDGIIQEIDRICGSTVVSYPLKDKVARINQAQDRYFELAFKSSKQWNFDDVNQTTPPIDTQNLVSGTNRYKISAFSEKILSVLRLEILTDAAVGQFLIPEQFDNLRIDNRTNISGRTGALGQQTFQELYVNAPSGTPTHYIKYGDFIYLRPNPNYSETDGLKIYFDRALADFSFKRVTVTIATPGVFSATAHGMVLNDTVVFNTSSALPTGLTAGTTYYVITAGLTADAFQVSATLGGSAVNTSVSQSGVHTFLQTNVEPGIPGIHHDFLANLASLKWLSDKMKPQWNAVAMYVKEGEQEIIKYFSERGKDITPRLIPRIDSSK